jgi:hypothetical protein
MINKCEEITEHRPYLIGGFDWFMEKEIIILTKSY